MRRVYEALHYGHSGKSIHSDLIADLKKRHPENPEAHHMISVELSRLGERLDEARIFAERAVKAEPWNARARHQLALTLMRLERPEQAEAELRKAIELDRSVDWWNYQLAQVLYRQQKHAPCIDSLREYLVRRPDSSDAWQLVGRCHEALDNTEDAAEAFVQAADARPDWTWPLLKLANLRVRSKTDPEQGLVATDRLLETLFHARQRVEVYILRSQLHEIHGQRAKAIEAALRSTELAPDWEMGKHDACTLVRPGSAPDAHGQAWIAFAQLRARQGRPYFIIEPGVTKRVSMGWFASFSLVPGLSKHGNADLV